MLRVPPCRRAAAHHQVEAVVSVRRAGRKVRLVTRRRRPLHAVPAAHAGDGAWEEGLGRGMPKPPLAQLIAANFGHVPSPSPFNLPSAPTVSPNIDLCWQQVEPSRIETLPSSSFQAHRTRLYSYMGNVKTSKKQFLQQKGTVGWEDGFHRREQKCCCLFRHQDVSLFFISLLLLSLNYWKLLASTVRRVNKNLCCTTDRRPRAPSSMNNWSP